MLSSGLNYKDRTSNQHSQDALKTVLQAIEGIKLEQKCDGKAHQDLVTRIGVIEVHFHKNNLTLRILVTGGIRPPQTLLLKRLMIRTGKTSTMRNGVIGMLVKMFNREIDHGIHMHRFKGDTTLQMTNTKMTRKRKRIMS